MRLQVPPMPSDPNRVQNSEIACWLSKFKSRSCNEISFLLLAKKIDHMTPPTNCVS